MVGSNLSFVLFSFKTFWFCSVSSVQRLDVSPDGLLLLSRVGTKNEITWGHSRVVDSLDDWFLRRISALSTIGAKYFLLSGRPKIIPYKNFQYFPTDRILPYRILIFSLRLAVASAGRVLVSFLSNILQLRPLFISNSSAVQTPQLTFGAESKISSLILNTNGKFTNLVSLTPSDWSRPMTREQCQLIIWKCEVKPKSSARMKLMFKETRNRIEC